jgi:hypothetical protein
MAMMPGGLRNGRFIPTNRIADSGGLASAGKGKSGLEHWEIRLGCLMGDIRLGENGRFSPLVSGCCNPNSANISESQMGKGNEAQLP